MGHLASQNLTFFKVAAMFESDCIDGAGRNMKICWYWGKRANLKTGVTRKQTTPNFQENEHFLPPNTHTYIPVRIRGKERFVLRKIWWAFFSWNTRFEIFPFVFLTTSYFLKVVRTFRSVFRTHVKHLRWSFLGN